MWFEYFEINYKNVENYGIEYFNDALDLNMNS